MAREITITISKYHSWYLCQISLQVMVLPIQTKYHRRYCHYHHHHLLLSVSPFDHYYQL